VARKENYDHYLDSINSYWGTHMKTVAIQLVLLLVVVQAAQAQGRELAEPRRFGSEHGSTLPAPALHASLGDAAGSNAAGHRFQPSASAFWLHVGAGWMTRESLSGASPAGIVGASWQPGASIYSVRWTITEELAFFGGEAYALNEFGVLYGRGTRPGLLHASASAGIAWVTGERQADTGRPEDVSTVGLPLELQLALRVLPFLGVALSGVANWNPEESFAGAVLSVQAGRLR
jgi:hypothetical protein